MTNPKGNTAMTPHHASRETFDNDLRILRDNVLRLSNLTDSAIERSMRSMMERDDELARQVIKDDKPINRMRYEVEEECYRLIATQQPLARDLRSIVCAIHIVVELERIADHAAGVSKIALELNQEPALKPLIDLPRMAEISREMLAEAVDAYLNWDEEKAILIKKRDDEVDLLDSQVYRELLTYMLQDARNITRATHLLWASHNLERIADRITNICERVMFMVTGNVRN